MLAQQLCGLPVLIFFTPLLLMYLEDRYERMHSTHEALIIISTALMMVANIATAYLVDRVGRRPLLKSGSLLSALSLASIATAMLSLHYEPSAESSLVALIVVALMIALLAFNISFSPLSWLVATELFSVHWRGRVLSLCVAASAVAQGGVFIGLQVTRNY